MISVESHHDDVLKDVTTVNSMIIVSGVMGVTNMTNMIGKIVARSKRKIFLLLCLHCFVLFIGVDCSPISAQGVKVTYSDEARASSYAFFECNDPSKVISGPSVSKCEMNGAVGVWTVNNPTCTGR